MNNETYMKIEKALTAYTYGNITGKAAKMIIKGVGYTIDLRTWFYNTIEVESIQTGELFEIEV